MKIIVVLVLSAAWIATPGCATRGHSNMGAPGDSSENTSGKSPAESSSDARAARGVIHLFSSPAQSQPTNIPR